jgi:hypothetical protein
MLPIDATPPGFGYGGAAGGGSADGFCTYSLQSIVLEIAMRAGMDPRTIDVTKLAGIECRGFTITNLYAAYGAIQALSSIFLFDPSNSDGQVRFIPRGMDTIATITEDDMLVTSDDSLDTIEDQSQRADTIQIPRVLHLNYYDINGGSATDKQDSERAGDWRATGEQSLQTAVILNSDEAKRAVAVNHNIMIEDQKSQLGFTLSDKWLKLTVADTVFVQYQGKTRRGRIIQVDMDDGQQAYKLLQDRQSAVMSNLQGFPAYVPTPPPSRIVGKTLIEAIDIHIINDGDDYLGCYVATSGSVPAWVGAQVDVSIDGGATFIDTFTVTREAIIGKIEAAMTDHPIAFPDEINTTIVHFDLEDNELEQTTLTGLLNKGNLAIIGDEVIQFKNATQDSSGDWHLSYFIRGRKGTASTSHAIGERFVLLDRSVLNFIPTQLFYLNRPVTLRATSLNGDATDVTNITFNYTGQSQVEYAPQYVSAHRASTNAVVNWQGVGKLGSGPAIAMGLYFAGYRLTLTDGVHTAVVDTAAMNATVDISTFSGAITASVVQRNSLTGFGPATSVTF